MPTRTPPAVGSAHRPEPAVARELFHQVIEPALADRVRRLEHQVQALTEVVAVLAEQVRALARDKHGDPVD
jgi:hypothetical protein